MQYLSTYSFHWQSRDLEIVLPILLALAGFICYWALSNANSIKDYYFRKYSPDEASTRHVLFSKYLGFAAMGVFPTVLALVFLPGYRLRDFGLAYIPETAMTSLIWTGVLGVIVFLLVHRNAKKPETLAHYPQIRAKVWTKKRMLQYATGWIVYLLGYEMLFRGVLLFPLAAAIGVYPAIAVNTALYSAIHLPYGIQQAIGAIPLGIILCLLTLATGTLWVAFAVHVIMALTNSFTALYHHPDMKIVK
jgi:membrane protease YdiL (CAAX protease family)